MHRSIVLWPPFLVALTGCVADTAPEPAPVDLAQSPIEGGYVDNDDKHAVGIIHLSNSAFGACSGTLIAPNVVLTAQHCVAPTSTNHVDCNATTFGSPYPANSLYVTTQTQFTQEASDYHRALEVHVAPGGPSFCGHDQALLILEQPISPEEAVPSTPRVDESLMPNEEYYAVGYGQTYDSDDAPSGTRYRRDNLFAQCVGGGCSAPDFIHSAEFLGDTAVCQGDSGGPAFDLHHRVTGVASRGSEGCETPVYGHVQALGDWIKDTTLYAASLSGAEPPPWATGYPTDPAYSHPVGEACSAPDTCPSNACLEGYCTRPCNELAACPEGYSCREDGWCTQLPPPEPAESEDDDDRTTVRSCSVATVGLSEGKDPTKPIPWEWIGVALGALVLGRRR